MIIVSLLMKAKEKDDSSMVRRNYNSSKREVKVDSSLYSPLIEDTKDPYVRSVQKKRIRILDKSSVWYKRFNRYSTIAWLAKWICILDFSVEFILFFVLLYSQYSKVKEDNPSLSYWKYVSTNEVDPYSYYRSVLDVLCLCLFRTLPSAYMFRKIVEIDV